MNSYGLVWIYTDLYEFDSIHLDLLIIVFMCEGLYSIFECVRKGKEDRLRI